MEYGRIDYRDRTFNLHLGFVREELCHKIEKFTLWFDEIRIEDVPNFG